VNCSALLMGFPASRPHLAPGGIHRLNRPAQTDTRAGRGLPHGLSLRRCDAHPSVSIIGIYLRDDV